MTTSQQALDDAGRKRHLEALFADEPFLSPTMKARRMHEKTSELRAREPGRRDRDLGAAFASDVEYAFTVLEEAAFIRPDRLPMDGTQISFADAAARLRGPSAPETLGDAQSDPIRYFRTQVLEQWIRKVEPRETE